MEFRIADAFTLSLSRLTGEEQKAAKTTAFDLQLNPANPGMKFHRLERTRDPNFWSVWANTDIRIIVHKTDASMLLCYVDHHNKAYDWAERRKLETHPKTGAAQIVEVREMVREITVASYTTTGNAPARPSKPPLFRHLSVEDLLDYGVPPDWISEVQGADEDRILEIAPHR